MPPTDHRNILYAYQNPPDYIAPVMYSTRQVTIGPNIADQTLPSGQIVGMTTPAGAYDLKAMIDRLPADQQPELILVMTDGSAINMPQGLDQFDVPKVLLVADTQHQDRPITTMVNYALSEAFDLIVMAYTRHHAHYFAEAGLSNIYWLPGMCVRDFGHPFFDEKHFPLTFVGRLGDMHPMRSKTVEALQTAGIEIITAEAPPERSREVFGRSILTLNPSLNADVNLRSFEVPLSGGCMLADRLSPQSGRGLIFEDGKHLITYGGFDELAEKARHYLANPATAVEIGKAAYDLAQAEYHPDIQRQVLLDLIDQNRIDQRYKLDDEKRCTAIKSKSTDDLLGRIAQYEFFQEQHRVTPSLSLTFLGGADPRLACDLVDLPRLNVHWAAEERPSLFEAAGVDQQVLSATSQSDYLVASASTDLSAFSGYSGILLSDWSDQAATQASLIDALGQVGFAHQSETCRGLFLK